MFARASRRHRPSFRSVTWSMLEQPASFRKCGEFSCRIRDQMQRRFISNNDPFPDRRPAGVPGVALRRDLLFGVLLTGLSHLAIAETVHGGNHAKPGSVVENPAVASELVDVVESFITAGEQNDPAARGKYLGPKVFYYGHARTHEQAVKAIAALYRRWPQRKFALTESLDLFEIPNHRGVYRATAVYDYKFENGDEHLSGKSKMTCVVEHDHQGTRIIGVDEKLLNGSTDYQVN